MNDVDPHESNVLKVGLSGTVDILLSIETLHFQHRLTGLRQFYRDLSVHE